jgi:integrase
MLLATYGLRGGEVMALRLSDVEWRHERLHIRHSKTGAYSDLPLLRGPANALLDYLKHARPKTPVREVFIRACAPYRGLTGHAALHLLLTRVTQGDRRCARSSHRTIDLRLPEAGH